MVETGSNIVPFGATWNEVPHYKDIDPVAVPGRFVRYVYLFENPSNGWTKIGVSRCPRRRAGKLIKKGARLCRSAILGPLGEESAFSFERNVLSLFSAEDLNGEWINRPFDVVLSIVTQMPAPEPMSHQECEKYAADQIASRANGVITHYGNLMDALNAARDLRLSAHRQVPSSKQIAGKLSRIREIAAEGAACTDAKAWQAIVDICDEGLTGSRRYNEDPNG